ncbi:MAG: hypothetical protein FWD75_05635 [Propionibacteriaceae bacterium]|nr:hypothetical protein [Propionibacteriaceae bacterium]
MSIFRRRGTGSRSFPHQGKSTLIIAVVLAGCGACAAMDTGSADPPFSVITYQPRGVGGDLALLEGRLTLIDGCLVVDRAEGMTLVYLPRPTLRYTTDGFWLYGRIYRLGDPVSWGGGGYGLQDSTIPPACMPLVDEMMPSFTVSSGPHA